MGPGLEVDAVPGVAVGAVVVSRQLLFRAAVSLRPGQ